MRCLPAVVLVLTSSPAFAQFAHPILGGTATRVGDWPSVVAIETGNCLCTGTLITPDWVLTAAHCVTPFAQCGTSTQDQVTQSIRVHFNTVDYNHAPGTVVTATATIPDPNFNINSLGSHDAGLIKLAMPVTNVMPSPV